MGDLASYRDGMIGGPSKIRVKIMNRAENMNIRMIGFDLDGTLLNDQKELTEYTRSVLSRAREKGVELVVATGRPVTGVPKELLEFPGMRYVLASNGGRIVDRQEKKVIYECPVGYDLAVRVLRIFDEYDTLKEIYFDGMGYAKEGEIARAEYYVGSQPVVEYIRSTRAGVPDLWEKMREMEGHGLDKVHAVFRREEDQKEARRRIEKLGGLVVTSAISRNLEANALGADKGTGLLRLGSYLGIPREEIMACGDGENDLAMIRSAGFGVAVENAVESVKEAADYITLSNNENGVALAVEKFVL